MVQFGRNVFNSNFLIKFRYVKVARIIYTTYFNNFSLSIFFSLFMYNYSLISLKKFENHLII